ncbi:MULTISPECIES: hypothetical protein [Prochlorococcus]|uniref:hypothetical protein n=1 Tax=Prochlorococcus TaxID=1218 RepID=UPI0005338516|nr:MULTISPECIES: hypothetical protein [Prochlorococcus]KGG11945.1 Cyanobacteria-specific protein containing UvrC-like endonuclease domain [Prochlorococcus sp. MIT 0601]
MQQFKRQGELFDDFDSFYQSPAKSSNELFLSKEVLENWQRTVCAHQSDLFQGKLNTRLQGSLFSQNSETPRNNLNPLKLTPLPINFWKWPRSDHTGPAIYLVMDKLSNSSNLLLYIGETLAAEKRWKGEHDCKKYVEAYLQSLQKAGLEAQLSIRFWSDVPQETKARRLLEQKLIQAWLPPFNKETRNRWGTPFTSDITP